MKVVTSTSPISVGQSVSAELPNIRGSYSSASNISSLYNPNGTFNGAFYASATSTTFRAGYTSEGASSNVAFDASLCSSIYKNSATTVVPESLITNFYIKY